MGKGWPKWFWFAWAVLAVVFASLLAPLNVPRFVHILRHEASVTAVVTGTACWNHASVLYSFTFEGRTYTGADSFTKQPCECYKPGSSITVYFSTASPEKNVTIEPWAGLWNEIISIALVCLIFPPLILLGLGRLWHRADQQAASGQAKG
jgi:hypothetical protein